MEKLQERKIEFLKWENEHLRSMIKDQVNNPNFIYSSIMTENKHEINYLISDNEELLSIYLRCSIMLEPRSYHRENKITKFFS
jgi:hypothetical protein